MSQPEHPTLFLDRCLGERDVRKELLRLGAKVEIHRQYFSDTAEDEKWVPAVAAKGWVILTADAEMRRHKLIQLAIHESRAACFYLTSKKLNGVDMATAFGRALQGIYRIVSTHTRPLQARVSKYGEIQVIEGTPL